MIIDFSASNFRSFRDEQLLSMNVEGGRSRHPSNYSLVEDDRIAILRTAAILGANASGKSNLLKAIAALRWIVLSSGNRKNGQPIPIYEPFRLSADGERQQITFDIEFVVPSGLRYRYQISFLRDRVTEERLMAFPRRSKAIVFERGPSDTWETIKFGGIYKGGSRKFPFFSNSAYLSRAGNDASSPEFIREIYNYFGNISYVPAGARIFLSSALSNVTMINAVSDLICLADTGVAKVTMEENESSTEIRLPEEMPDDLKEAILAENRMSAKFWIESQAGRLIPFDQDDMSSGTARLLEVLPIILQSLKAGSALTFDEIDAHFHTDLVDLILQLFHDDEVNSKGAQLIFSTHDTNVLNSSQMRRDQIWLVSKENGVSSLKSLDEYDKQYVRQDSPFESFYRNGRLGALPRLSYSKIKKVILSALGSSNATSTRSINA